MHGMQSKSVYKVPDGKLLKIFLDYNEKNGSINNIRITGDFFAYPEKGVEIIEKELEGEIIDKKRLMKKITEVVKKHGIEFIGLNIEGLAEGIVLCKYE